MPKDKYQIKTPTVALILREGRQVTHTIPKGAVITIESETFDGNKLVEVLWGEKSVMMFTQDLRMRGQKID